VKKIKVLHIIKSLGRGGAEILLPETLRIHDRDQFEFHYIYFLPWKDQLAGELKENGGLVTCVKASNNIEIFFRKNELIRYIKKNKIQLIHAHLPWAGIVARFVGRSAGIPVLYTEHNKQERYHWMTRVMNIQTMNLLSAVIAVSGDVADSVRKHKPQLKPPVLTILNGVNSEKFTKGVVTSHVREELGIDSGAKVVGTIAVFRFQKRLDVWLEAAAAIIRQDPSVRFLIVGDGPLKQELLNKCKMLGLDPFVYFAGLQREVRPYLAAMDVYMMSSVFEGLPIALLEAMAFGLPVATTDAGGIREVVRDGVEGLVCPVDETDQLPVMVLKLLSQPALRKTLGDHGRQRVRDYFSLEKMVKELETLYKKYLSQTTGRHVSG
jgi:L-malate glycosyltransferase